MQAGEIARLQQQVLNLEDQLSTERAWLPSQKGNEADFQQRQNLTSPTDATSAVISSMSMISTRLVGSPGGTAHKPACVSLIAQTTLR